MDEINNFFNFNRPIPEKPQTSTAPRQKRPTDPWDDELPKKLPEKSAKYAREHEKNLLERLKEVSKNVWENSRKPVQSYCYAGILQQTDQI